MKNYDCICGKNFTTSQGFNGHKGRCKEHMKSIGREIAPSNFIFAKKGGKLLSEAHRNAISKSLTGNPNNTGRASTPEKEEERKQKIRKTMQMHPNGGGLREGSGRGEKMWYESPIAGKVYLRSSYELRYVKILDRLKIKWEQNHVGFEYSWENETHRYYPDFYLIEEECYVEVKGFKTLKDDEKWNQFPHNLKIVYLEQIENMEKEVKER